MSWTYNQCLVKHIKINFTIYGIYGVHAANVMSGDTVCSSEKKIDSACFGKFPLS